MICEKCGKEYWTKECLNCKNHYTENDLQNMGITNSKKSLSEKEKLYKIIRYAIIFFIGIFVIGGIAEIYMISKVVDTATPTIKNMNKMTDTMNKATEQMMRDLEKSNETLRKMNERP